MTTNKVKELLPIKKLKPMLHRIKVGDVVYRKLEIIRHKNRLWDSEAAIIYLMKLCNEWTDEDEREQG